jgi:hypothetical protein
MINEVKNIITKEGYKLQVVKVYSQGERFYGKVLVKQDGCDTPSRFKTEYFNSIVQDQDKI